MKTQSKIIAVFILLVISVDALNAQSTNLGNTQIFATDFLGWNTIGIASPLDIKTEQTQPINFYTTAGAGGLANMRMQIFDAPGGLFNAGFVGIGNFAAFNPQNHVHQHQAGATALFHRFTNVTNITAKVMRIFSRRIDIFYFTLISTKLFSTNCV